MIPGLNSISSIWAGVAWAVCWQAVVVVLAFGLVAWWLRRSSPAIRGWVWHLAALKLLVMPFWGVALALPAWSGLPKPPATLAPLDPSPESDRIASLSNRSDSTGSLTLTSANPPSAAPSEPITWRSVLMLGWLGLVVVQVAGLIRQRGRLVRVLNRTTLAVDPDLCDLVRDLAGRVGLARVPATRWADGGTSPFVCNLGGPTLVLPADLVATLSPGALRAVLIHELAHLARRDLFWGWVPTLARLVYVGHPAAGYVAFRARLERELACDAAAMILADQGAASYAATLVAVVSRSVPAGVLVGFSH